MIIDYYKLRKYAFEKNKKGKYRYQNVIRRYIPQYNLLAIIMAKFALIEKQFCGKFNIYLSSLNVKISIKNNSDTKTKQYCSEKYLNFTYNAYDI